MEHPLRLIVDMSQFPYQSISKWLTKLLDITWVRLSKHSLRDLFYFIECIKETDVSKKGLFSLDICLLLTNQPLLKADEFICDNIVDGDGIPILIPNMNGLILRCILNTPFVFNEILYSQKVGVAMRSPLGPLLAN